MVKKDNSQRVLYKIRILQNSNIKFPKFMHEAAFRITEGIRQC